MILTIVVVLYEMCFGIYLIALLSDYMYVKAHRKIVKNCTNEKGQVDLDQLETDRKIYIETQFLIYTARVNDFSLTTSTKLWRLNRDNSLNAIEYAQKYGKKMFNTNLELYDYFVLAIKIVGFILFIVGLIFLIFKGLDIFPLYKIIE